MVIYCTPDKTKLQHTPEEVREWKGSEFGLNPETVSSWSEIFAERWMNKRKGMINIRYLKVVWAHWEVMWSSYRSRRRTALHILHFRFSYPVFFLLSFKLISSFCGFFLYLFTSSLFLVWVGSLLSPVWVHPHTVMTCLSSCISVCKFTEGWKLCIINTWVSEWYCLRSPSCPCLQFYRLFLPCCKKKLLYTCVVYC